MNGSADPLFVAILIVTAYHVSVADPIAHTISLVIIPFPVSVPSIRISAVTNIPGCAFVVPVSAVSWRWRSGVTIRSWPRVYPGSDTQAGMWCPRMRLSARNRHSGAL